MTSVDTTTGEIPGHGFQLLPPLTPEEVASLAADIRANGVRVPIDVDEHGVVLDGHHRKAIAAKIGIDCPTRVITGFTDEQKRSHALAVNVHRRELNRDQRRALIKASILADPDLSDRQHGERTGADHKTVATVREALQSTGEIPQLPTRTGSDGKSRPASQPPRVEIRFSTEVERELKPHLAAMKAKVRALQADIEAATQEQVDELTDRVVEEWRARLAGGRAASPQPVPDPAPDDSRRDQELEEITADERFLLSLATAVKAAAGLPLLSADRVVEVLTALAGDAEASRYSLLSTLDQIESWGLTVRRGLGINVTKIRSVR